MIQFKLDKEITIDDSIETMRQLFINRDDDYAIQSERGYRRADEPLSDDTIAEHMLGIKTIGTYQISNENTIKWLCIDVDAHSDDEIIAAKCKCAEIFIRLRKRHLPFIIETSGTPHSYHFWLFFVPTESNKVYWFGRELFGDIDTEIYPKQPKLTTDKNYGNLVKLPFGVNRKNGEWSRVIYKTDELYLIDIGDYTYEHTKDNTNNIVSTGSTNNANNANNIVLPTDMRPCMRACANGRVQMTGNGGHLLRCALVPELKQCANMTVEQITEVFKSQTDFNYGKTLYQVNSVYNYNRISCKRIQRDALDKIGEYCERCNYNECNDTQ